MIPFENILTHAFLGSFSERIIHILKFLNKLLKLGLYYDLSLGSINEEDTGSESTEDQEEWSEEEFLLSYNDALEWVNRPL